MGNLCCGQRGKEEKKRNLQSSFLMKYRVNEFGEAKILFIGLDNSGKTTIYKRMLGEDESDIKPTGGFFTKKMNYNEDLTLELTDIGGSEKVRNFWKNYYRNMDGVIYVVDAADQSKFDQSSTVLFKVMEDAKLKGIPFMILAHKQDADGAKTESEIHSAFKLDDVQDRVCWVKGSTIQDMDRTLLDPLLE